MLTCEFIPCVCRCLLSLSLSPLSLHLGLLIFLWVSCSLRVPLPCHLGARNRNLSLYIFSQSLFICCSFSEAPGLLINSHRFLNALLALTCIWLKCATVVVGIRHFGLSCWVFGRNRLMDRAPEGTVSAIASLTGVESEPTETSPSVAFSRTTGASSTVLRAFGCWRTTAPEETKHQI